jgi:hypothetical protein
LIFSSWQRWSMHKKEIDLLIMVKQ